jgi:hypothetical protein
MTYLPTSAELTGLGIADAVLPELAAGGVLHRRHSKPRPSRLCARRVSDPVLT